jgi:hypothetical protein
MKKNWMIITGVGFAVLLSLAGCNKVKDLLNVTFTTNNVEATFTVEPAAAGNFTSTQNVVTSDLKDQISSQGGNIGSLKSVEVDTCTISVVTAERNLNAFQSVEVWVQVTGQAEKKIAWIDNVPDNVTAVGLAILSDDIKALIDNDQYTVTVKGVLDSALETAIDLKATIKYKVVVGAK